MSTTDSETRTDAVVELVDANHVLVGRGILDAFGQVSVRDPRHPDSLLISRNLAPGVVADADIQEVALGASTTDDRPSHLERFQPGCAWSLWRAEARRSRDSLAQADGIR